MPELPEVETVRRGLEPFMAGAQIVDLRLNREDLRFPFPKNFKKRLTGETISRLDRRAKYLLIYLSGGAVIIAHLGMSGRFVIEAPGAEGDRKDRIIAHDHVIFTLKGPKGACQIIYNDPRRFGFMDLVEREGLWQTRHFANMGPEPMGNAFNWPVLAARLQGRKTAIKQALLDQKIVAGLGNIYVCEALWQAGISPRRAAFSVGVARGERLVVAVQEILARAIEAGGSSLRDHAQPDGDLGYFQHDFAVYDREGEPCPKCGAPVKRFTQGGRSSFFCGGCQR
jgi:formamidopyrimidine-DNA glycosylase